MNIGKVIQEFKGVLWHYRLLSRYVLLVNAWLILILLILARNFYVSIQISTHRKYLFATTFKMVRVPLFAFWGLGNVIVATEIYALTSSIVFNILYILVLMQFLLTPLAIDHVRHGGNETIWENIKLSKQVPLS